MAKWNWGGGENQGVGRIAACGDRAGGASPLSPQAAVSTEGAHPLRDLADRCEKATGPDRELDKAIAETANCFKMVGKAIYAAPYFTASLDAAMTLAAEFGGQVTFFKDGTAKAFLWQPYPLAVEAKAATPALALCAAALRARDSDGSECRIGEEA